MDFSFDTLAYAIILILILYILKKLISPPDPPQPVRRLEPRKPLASISNSPDFQEFRSYTRTELLAFRGENGAPLLVGIKGKVYDVSAKASFYGPGASYHVFTGHDASRALAKGSLNPDDVKNSDISDLSPSELETLEDWIQTFSKYPVVGDIVD